MKEYKITIEIEGGENNEHHTRYFNFDHPIPAFQVFRMVIELAQCFAQLFRGKFEGL